VTGARDDDRPQQLVVQLVGPRCHGGDFREHQQGRNGQRVEQLFPCGVAQVEPAAQVVPVDERLDRGPSLDLGAGPRRLPQRLLDLARRVGRDGLDERQVLLDEHGIQPRPVRLGRVLEHERAHEVRAREGGAQAEDAAQRVPDEHDGAVRCRDLVEQCEQIREKHVRGVVELLRLEARRLTVTAQVGRDDVPRVGPVRHQVGPVRARVGQAVHQHDRGGVGVAGAVDGQRLHGSGA